MNRAVNPINSPMMKVREKPSGKSSFTDEFFPSSKAPKKQAEIINMARPNASCK